MKTAEQIEQDFHSEAEKVWTNYYHPVVEVTIKRRTSKKIPLMAIYAGHTNYRTKAIGSALRYRVIKPIRLIVTDDALELSDDEYRALLRHEAIHMGYPRHDKDFLYQARKYSAPVTEMEQKDATYKVQVKEGSRFKTVKEFPVDSSARFLEVDEGYMDARRYAKKIYEEKRVRVRIQR